MTNTVKKTKEQRFLRSHWQVAPCILAPQHQDWPLGSKLTNQKRGEEIQFA